MSRTHYNEGSKRHAGPGGINMRTTHAGAEVLYDPNTPGLPFAEARDGQQSQVPDIAPRVIQTNHFDLLAAAPQVNNNPLAPVDAEVIIDETGITIKNGKLFLEDYGGLSVLGPAGFDGSWVEFIHTGVYNGGFNAGITNWIAEGTIGFGDEIEATTIVSDAATPEDYQASLSAAIPYWIVSQYTSTVDQTMVAYIAADEDEGRALVVERKTNGLGGLVEGGLMEFTQDVPIVEGVAGESPYEVEVSFKFDASAGGTEASYLLVRAGWRSSTHENLSDVVTQHNLTLNPSIASDPSGTYTFDVGAPPANAKYCRVAIGVEHGQNASGLGRLCSIYNVRVRPTPIINELLFPIQAGSSRIVSKLGISDAGPVFTLAETPSGYHGLRVHREDDASAMFSVVDYGAGGGIDFGSGAASADVVLRRSAANVLELGGGDYFSRQGELQRAVGASAAADLIAKYTPNTKTAVTSVGTSDTEVSSNFRVTFPGNATMAGKTALIRVTVEAYVFWATGTPETNASIVNHTGSGVPGDRLTFAKVNTPTASVYYEVFTMGIDAVPADSATTWKVVFRRASGTANMTLYGHATAPYVSSISYQVLGYY